jgi:capsular polysaccharide biosynthesis protein
MDKVLAVVLGLCICGVVFCLAMLPSTMKYEMSCREQGGIPVKGVCLKVETVKVVH